MSINTEATTTTRHRKAQHNHSSDKANQNNGKSNNNKISETTSKVAEEAIKSTNTPADEFGVKGYALGDIPVLKERIGKLETEKVSLDKQISFMAEEKKSFKEENARLYERITKLTKEKGIQSDLIGEMQKQIKDISAKAEAKFSEAPVSNELEAAEKIGSWPMVDHLEKIQIDQKAIFERCRTLGKNINALRDICQTLQNTMKSLSAEELKKLLDPKQVSFDELAKEATTIRPEVEKAKKNLEDIIRAATFEPIPAIHQKSFSSMQKISMEKISKSTEQYQEALAKCKLELKLFSADLDKMITRFGDTVYNINTIGAHLDTKSYLQVIPGWRPAPRVKSPFA